MYIINIKDYLLICLCPLLFLKMCHFHLLIVLNKENNTFDIVKTTTKELDNNEKLVIRVLDSEILEKTNTKKV